MSKFESTGIRPKFIPIYEKAMINKVFGVATKYKLTVTFWTKDQQFRFDSNFYKLIQEHKIITTHLPHLMKDQDFISALKTQGSETIFGNLQIDGMYFFFKAKTFSQLHMHQFSIEIPHEIYKLQRRQNVRVPFSDARRPRITFLDPIKLFDPVKPLTPADLIIARGLDISAGGICVEIQKHDHHKFHRGNSLLELKFKLRDYEIAVDGKVAYLKEVKKGKDKSIIKLGIQFKDLKPFHERQIAQYVLEESRKIFSLLY